MTALLNTGTALIAVAAFATTALLTGFVRTVAAERRVLDFPNSRSSHRVPTPRGGGAAIVIVSTAGMLLLALCGRARLDLAWTIGGGGLAVALVGLADDRRSVSAAVRLTVHFAAAFWALAWLGGLPSLQVGTHLVSFGWMGYVLGALGVVWVLNLFNFMDGIDGLAAVEAIFIPLGGASLSGLTGGASSAVDACVLFAAACGGFLVWNWPPARIFLGDVGSGYIGYVVAVLTLAAPRDKPAAMWVWTILGGVFIADATVTLVRRMLRGERPYEAHRSHAYQWLARRWRSHAKVTLAVLAVDLAGLLPCAVAAALYPEYAALTAFAVLAVLAAISLIAGAGRSEQRTASLTRPP